MMLRHLLSRRFSSRLIHFSFVEGTSGNKISVCGSEGATVLDVALKHNIDIEGACGGELACSTCHVVLSTDLFNKLSTSKSEEEDDMLDLAWGVTKT